MTNKNQEQCSCLVDGELKESECHEILDKISSNKTLKQNIHRYFLIRDTLQSSLPSVINTSFSQSVMEAIESEPAILAPNSHSTLTNKTNRSSTSPKSNLSRHHFPKRVASFAIAASVATIAVFTYNSTNNVEPRTDQFAQMPDSSEFIRLSKSTSGVPNTTRVTATGKQKQASENVLVSQSLNTSPRTTKTITNISNQQIQKYIINYNHHISSSRLQSVTPYARIIATKAHNQMPTREQNPQ